MRNEYEQVWLNVIEKYVNQGTKVKHDAFIWRRLDWWFSFGRSLGKGNQMVKVKVDELD